MDMDIDQVAIGMDHVIVGVHHVVVGTSHVAVSIYCTPSPLRYALT
jgi:hypothetical protein